MEALGQRVQEGVVRHLEDAVDLTKLSMWKATKLRNDADFL